MARHYYAIYIPCGLNTLNLEGNQANRLYRYGIKAQRDALVTDYPDKVVATSREQVERILRETQYWEYEAPQVEFATFMGN